MQEKNSQQGKDIKKTMPMLHHFFSNYGIVFYYPNDLVTTQHPYRKLLVNKA